MATSKITVPNLVSEFIGTYLLVLTVGCNVLGGSGTWAALSIASVLMVCVYSLGPVSGGHFNPAVTLALTITGDHGSVTDALAYMATQLVAGFMAGMSYLWLYNTAFQLEPGANFGGAHAAAVEILYTFMLCFVVLRVAASPKSGCGDAKNEHFGLAIGFVIVAGGYAGGWVSKGCFNPAVAFGIDIASAGMGVYWCALYTLFEFVGAAAAAAVYMVIKDDDKSTLNKFLSEFIGTFFLVLTVGLNVLGKSPAAALSIAASLMCMIYALGPISGGHFNPAVTLAIAITNSKFGEVPLYMAAQCLGALAAGLTYGGITGESVPLAPGAGHDMTSAAFAEIIYTFVLCFTVLNVAVAGPAADKDYNVIVGLAIGFCVVVGGYAIGSVSGGSLNPAVSFGLDASHAIKGGSFFNCLPYAAFELAGGALAAVAFGVCQPAAVEQSKKAGFLPLFGGKTYGTI